MDVLMELAFSWKCPLCGKRNFVRSVPVEWSESDLRLQLGLEPWEAIPEDAIENTECVAAPVKVSCECGGKFGTIHAGDQLPGE